MLLQNNGIYLVSSPYFSEVTLYVCIFERFNLNVLFYWSNFIYNYNSFSFLSVLSTLLFIIMFLTYIFLTILNSDFWLLFILIVHFYNSNYDFISEIEIIIIIFFPLLFLVIQYRWVFCSPRAMCPNHRRCGLLFLLLFSIVVILLMSETTVFDRQLHQKYFPAT